MRSLLSRKFYHKRGRLSTGSPEFVKNFHKTLDKGGRGVL